MKMGEGFAKVPQMRDAGVTVALGCDAGANNNCHDMIREMKAASLLHNVRMMDPTTLTAEDALEMATIEGARAIGRGDQLGSLEAGKQADVILVDLRRPHTMPIHDPIANLVFSAHGGNVDTVIVAGQVLMRGRQVLVADEAAILEEAQERVRRCWTGPGSRWPRHGPSSEEEDMGDYLTERFLRLPDGSLPHMGVKGGGDVLLMSCSQATPVALRR